MKNTLEILAWDSAFFGYPVARVRANKMSITVLDKILDEARNTGVRLVYVFSDPADGLSKASVVNCAGKLVDEKVTFKIAIKENKELIADAHISFFSAEEPTEKLIALALQSGAYSRFKLDEHFRNNEFEKLYNTWIINSVNKSVADRTFVYNNNGEELGFVTVKIKDGYGDIGLIAVDESSRGKSIGRKLVDAVIKWLSTEKIDALEVATQKNNADACNFYSKIGFHTNRVENIYHIWL